MARTFTGTGTYIDIGSISTPSTAITLAAWMYPTEGPNSNQQESALIYKQFGFSLPFFSYQLTISTSDVNFSPDLKLGISGNIYDAQKTDHSFSLNTWYHMAGTWASGDNSRLYINGVQEGISSGTASGTIDYGAFNTFIGRNSLDSKVFRGRIAEACIWDVQLSANEVAVLARGCRPYQIRLTDLNAYYPLWGTHDPETDLSSSHVTGTITGTLNASNHAPVTVFTSSWNTQMETEVVRRWLFGAHQT